MRLPDFIIAGAPRSGTTWLCHLLDRHPDVQIAQPVIPEPKFFHRDEIYARGARYYSETWFAGLTAPVVGEKTSYYLENPRAAGRIHSMLPDVKLVFILREPVSRAYSNYLRSRANGFETLDFEAALEAEAERERTLPADLRFVRPNAYYSRGRYAELLRPYFSLFPRSNIIVLRFEDIGERPGDLAARLHEFIGVDPRPQDGTTLGVINEQTSSEPRPENVLARLRERFRPENEKLEALTGHKFW